MPGPTDSVKMLISRSGSWADANARLEIGDIIWEQVYQAGDCPGAFFDGTTASSTELTNAWTGTADASTSTMSATGVAADVQSAFPPIYRSLTCATTGYSAAMAEGSYVEPSHNTEPSLNGMVAGHNVAASFDACRDGTGTLNVILFTRDPGGSLVAQTTTLTAPLAGRYQVTGTVPSTAETAFWRWYVATGGETCYISRLMIEDNVTQTGDFFDGSQPPAYWTGTADASYSNLDPPVLEVTLPTGEYNDGLPSYSQIVTDGQVTVESVNAYYYDVEAPTTLVNRVNRILKSATCTEGPTITEQYSGNTAFMKKAEFVITCPDPWAYGNPVSAAVVTSGVASSLASGVTMTGLLPGTYDLTCYAEDVSYVPTDANCGTIPKPPRPIPVDPCDPGPNNRGLLFFIPPTMLEELAGTYPIITIHAQTVVQKGTQVRCWPLPKPGATIDDISACDTRGWLRIGGIPANQGFILDCAARTGTITGVKVTGGYINMPATHFVYPPPSIPAISGHTVDQIPLQWPEMYGGNDGYFIYIEQNSSVAPTLDLTLETRR